MRANYFGEWSRYDGLALRVEMTDFRYGGREQIWTMRRWYWSI